jgi:hypothetical protein
MILLSLAIGLSSGFFGLSTASSNLTLHPWTPYLMSGTAPELRAQFHYLSSQANWNRFGSPFQPNGLNYQRLITDLSVAHPLGETWSTFGRVSLSGIRSQSPTQVGGRIGFADQTIGVQHQFKAFEKVQARAQFQVDFPTYQPEPHDLTLGVGSLDFTGGGFLSYLAFPSRKLDLNLWIGAGLTYRTGYYSAAIPWQVGAHLKSHPSRIELEVALSGVSSLKSDPHSYSPAFFRENLGRDSSLISGAMNPSWIQGKVQLGYRWGNQTFLAVSATKSIWGQMSPQLTGMGIQFQLPLQGQASSSTPPATEAGVGSSGQPVNPSFLDTSAEVHITKTNERLGLIKISLGSEEGIRVGDEFNVISKVEAAKNPIARARVTHLRNHESALKILEYYKDHWISEDCSLEKVRPLPVKIMPQLTPESN